ncbi:MAG: SLBB domain-containing protein, partial [Gammaproteobacteria bacterium]
MGFSRFFRTLLLSVALALPSLSFAQSPTPQQLQMLQQLSPQQRAELLQKLGGQKGSQFQQSDQPLQTPQVVKPQPSSQQAQGAAEPAGESRITGGSTLILKLTEKPEEQATQNGGKAAEEQAPVELSGAVTRLLGSNVFTVDPNGVLDLAGIDRIPLGGLTAEQAAQRLGAEPAFKDVTVDVTLLPVEPVGPAALKPFGYDLFSGVPTTFAPATDIPVPSDYVIGPGDTVQVQLFGKDNSEYSLVVTRDGTLNFPGLGPVPVTGLTFAELRKNLEKRVREQMIGVKASITMGALRSIRVFVLGDARRPGSYTVSALSTMTNALFVSGGIDKIGSLRDIQLKRHGKVITHLDLYDLLLHGDTSHDRRLLPGDVIFVPPVGDTVGVSGEVKRPAIYELKNETTVGQVVKLAGGLLPNADPKVTQLERVGTNQERTLVDVDLSKAAGRSMHVRDGDVVRVYSVLGRLSDVVTLAGHVERPGKRQWRQGMRLTDLISSADDLRPRADMHYVLIRRELPPDRRVQVFSADLAAALRNPNSSANVALRPRDKVLVFGLDGDRGDLIKPII